jgi:HSP20 family protein
MDVQGEMNRILDEAFGGLARQSGCRQDNGASRWAPAIDAVSEDGDLVIRAELPGVKLEDVDITLQDGVLTVSGERKAEREKEGSGYYVRERRHGSFRRSMSLPEGTDESGIHARFEDGILEVRVEGAAAIREPKRIAIEGANGEGSGS